MQPNSFTCVVIGIGDSPPTVACAVFLPDAAAGGFAELTLAAQDDGGMGEGIRTTADGCQGRAEAWGTVGSAQLTVAAHSERWGRRRDRGFARLTGAGRDDGGVDGATDVHN